MRLVLANDHGGYCLKLALAAFLEKAGHQVENLGTDSTEIVRYPYYAARACQGILSGRYDRGILICSTGIGMSIAANKFPGIRAALCASPYEGKMTAAHNNSNVLCLGGRCIGDLEACDIVERWLSTPYEAGRHDISLKLILEIEEHNASGALWFPSEPGKP